MVAIQEKAYSLELRKITLWVHWENAASIPFYYQHGFTIKAASKTKSIPFVLDGEDIIVMEKSL